MSGYIIPSKEDLLKFILLTIQHSSHVEYYISKLNVSNPNDRDRPHDIVGSKNKLEWKIMKGLALEYTMPKIDTPKDSEHIKHLIEHAYKLHRQQYHHQMWNGAETKAKIPDMQMGAIDAICSQLEDRSYQGGRHSWEQLLEIIEQNPPHKKTMLHEMLARMKEVEAPKLDLIASLDIFPNIGIPYIMYEEMKHRVHNALAHINWLYK